MIKTADAKAKVVCHKLKLPDCGPAFSIIRNAIKEQDRDTRHACAEACLQMDEPLDSSAAPSMAHDICMNVKAV